MVSVKTKTGVLKDAGRWIPEFWPGSVSQDVPTANAFGGQDVKRGLGEVICGIAVVAVLPKRGLFVPQTSGVLSSLLLLGDDSAISPLCFPNANGFRVGVVKERGRVRFPRAIEIIGLTATVGAGGEARVAFGPACLQPVVFGHVGLQRRVFGLIHPWRPEGARPHKRVAEGLGGRWGHEVW